MGRVLVTVSGRRVGPEVVERIKRGASRRIDYLEMADSFDADLIDYTTAERGKPIQRLITRLGGANLGLAWACFRRRRAYDVIFADGEQVALPLAAMLRFLAPFDRRKPHLLQICHDIFAPKKRRFFELLHVQSEIDYHIVFAQAHKDEMMRRWQIPAAQIVTMHFMVDSRFFSPTAVQRRRTSSRPQLCAVGIEARDYPTLIKAVEGLELDLVIAASSPWSHQADSSSGITPPPNVCINRDPKLDVRQLYADSDLVVMPLFNVDRAAGSTAILEAMSMGKPVICTRTIGQRDHVIEGETGLYVPPGDVVAMRAAIQRLLDNPAELARMGAAGRRRIEQEMNLDAYVATIGGYVQQCLDGKQPQIAGAKTAHGD
jgi:glycosyltransferase involved in cell wall biosynthesis